MVLPEVQVMARRRKFVDSYSVSYDYIYTATTLMESSVMTTTVDTEVTVCPGTRPPLTHIVDVDQPRHDEEFNIDWVRLGCAVKRKVKRVKDLLYNDDRADLAEIIDNYGPADIDLHGRRIIDISITGLVESIGNVG